MANVISLNTTDHPGLSQVLVSSPGGLFDFLAQKSGSTVTLSASAQDQVKKSAAKKVAHPTNGKPWLVES